MDTQARIHEQTVQLEREGPDPVVVGLTESAGAYLLAERAVSRRDPLEGHRILLPVYTDKDIHDVTAYLVTLK